ncbi:S8 family serine peptidase [Candidatus Berkelbacteria bacterium]|nr:S8 family serine peptidase [Candidatus Berkelbacteria bacterium]
MSTLRPLLLAIALAGGGWLVPALASGDATTQYLVTFTTEPNEALITHALDVSARDVEVNATANVATIRLPETSSTNTALLAALPGVSSVEEDGPIQLFRTPNDPNVSSQSTALTQVGAYNAWDYVQGKTTATIAVLDTGIDGTHEDLTGKVVAGKNILTGAAISANSDSDDNGHGTNIAGVAAATGNNSVGIAGVDWNARLMPVKAFNSEGVATTSDIVDGISYAASNGATVIVMSFGRSTPSDALEAAINAAANQGILLVAASGNDGTGSVNYPAAYSNVIGVGAVDSSNNRASFSSYGPELDLVAPGVSVYTTADGGGYTSVSGTSLAAPFVAGAITVTKDFHSSAARAAVTSILQDTAATVSGMNGASRTDEYGHGLLNVGNAVTTAGSYSGTVTYWSSSDGAYTYPSLNDGETATLSIQYLNTGTSRWFPGLVNLGLVDTNFNYRFDSYQLASNWLSTNRLATLNEASVAPGETGSFTFTIRNPGGLAGGNYRLDVGLVADGITWFPRASHAYWDVTVPQAYAAQWVSQSPYPTLTDGQSTAFSIAYRNTGSATWTRGTVNLGTVDTNFRYRLDGYGLAHDWLSANRPAQLNESSVAPGAVGTFTFTVRNPGGLAGGNHRLDVGLVADGITWFSRASHAYWDITVPEAYSAQWLGQTIYPTLGSGEATYGSIQYRNTGSATWYQGTVNLGLVDTNYRYRLDSYELASNWLSGNRLATLTESAVAPGQVGTFTFRLANPGGLSTGNHRLDVGLVADGITWFSQATHAYWDVTVR